MRRGPLLAGLLAVGMLAVIPVGRWEAERRAASEVRGMTQVLEAIGPLDSSTLAGYRRFPVFDCLAYRRGEEPFSLEVCIDHAGRVVEAIDRRSGEPRIWSVRTEPERSTLRVDRAEVERLLRRMRAPGA